MGIATAQSAFIITASMQTLDEFPIRFWIIMCLMFTLRQSIWSLQYEANHDVVVGKKQGPIRSGKIGDSQGLGSRLVVEMAVMKSLKRLPRRSNEPNFSSSDLRTSTCT